MKVIITGPASGLTKDGKLPHLHLEVVMDELPRPGEIIILNDGASYTVQYVMRWIDTREDVISKQLAHEDIGTFDEPCPADIKHISVTVEPSEGGFVTAHRMEHILRPFADLLTEVAGTEEERKARHAKLIKEMTGR